MTTKTAHPRPEADQRPLVIAIGSTQLDLSHISRAQLAEENRQWERFLVRLMMASYRPDDYRLVIWADRETCDARDICVALYTETGLVSWMPLLPLLQALGTSCHMEEGKNRLVPELKPLLELLRPLRLLILHRHNHQRWEPSDRPPPRNAEIISSRDLMKGTSLDT